MNFFNKFFNKINGNNKEFLEAEKNEEDLYLAENCSEDVLCDDGLKRRYDGFMHGIISEQYQTKQYITVLPDYFLHFKYWNDLKTPIKINNKIDCFKWFNIDGKTINKAEILKLNDERNIYVEGYIKRYQDILESGKINYFTLSYLNYSVIKINDYFFFTTKDLTFEISFDKYLLEPFNGTIDNLKIVNGELLKTNEEINLTKDEFLKILNSNLSKIEWIELETKKYSVTEKIKGEGVWEGYNFKFEGELHLKNVCLSLYNFEDQINELKAIIEKESLNEIDSKRFDIDNEGDNGGYLGDIKVEWLNEIPPSLVQKLQEDGGEEILFDRTMTDEVELNFEKGAVIGLIMHIQNKEYCYKEERTNSSCKYFEYFESLLLERLTKDDFDLFKKFTGLNNDFFKETESELNFMSLDQISKEKNITKTRLGIRLRHIMLEVLTTPKILIDHYYDAYIKGPISETFSDGTIINVKDNPRIIKEHCFRFYVELEDGSIKESKTLKLNERQDEIEIWNYCLNKACSIMIIK